MIRSDRPAFPFPLFRFWLLRILPVWFLTAAMIFLMQIAVCGIIHDNENVKALLGFIDLLPPIMKSAIGGESLQVGNISALIAIGYNHPLVLTLYMLFAVGVPTGLLAGEVEGGRMELMLSRATTKTQVYVCAGIITTVGMFGLVIVMFLGTVTATAIYDFGEPVALYRFFQIALNAGLLAATVGAISLLCAASFRRRGAAVCIAAGYLIVNYFISVTAGWWPRIACLKSVTIFHYANGRKIFAQHLWPVREMLILLIVLAVAAAAGGIIWQKRDIAS
ncbi:MAG: hypothetical protein JW720_07325 [Sedimentisphaerales bacterium]|nr:hypothetical protein [Sedimentisphaerales bacterium]